ncbi:MAG: flavoprotein [Verrucomicrobiota bacterium]
MSVKEKTIVLGVTGSIAAYKAADIASQLTKKEAKVFAVMTKEAAQIIGPIALQTLTRNPVSVDLWKEGDGWQPGHIELADKADLVLVAPATANIVGCFAQGLAPDMLTSIYLATPAPVMIAPAMNGKMLNHPAVQANLEILKLRGVEIIEPQENGMLACGYEGAGKLAPVEEIVSRVESHFA